MFTPKIFDRLQATESGVGRELQLTDAIRELSSARGVELKRDRYDIGNIPSWLQANIRMALKDDGGDMREAVERILRSELDE